MLVLSRKPNESIVLSDDIEIRVISVKGNTIRLGVSAPRHVRVLRGELAPFGLASTNDLASMEDTTESREWISAEKLVELDVASENLKGTDEGMPLDDTQSSNRADAQSMDDKPDSSSDDNSSAAKKPSSKRKRSTQRNRTRHSKRASDGRSTTASGRRTKFRKPSGKGVRSLGEYRDRENKDSTTDRTRETSPVYTRVG